MKMRLGKWAAMLAMAAAMVCAMAVSVSAADHIVQAEPGANYSVIPFGGVQTVPSGGSYSFVVVPNEGYRKSDQFCVGYGSAYGKYGNLTPIGNVYTINSIYYNHVIYVEGIEPYSAPEDWLIIDEAHFEDYAFRLWLLKNLDIDGDGLLSPDTVAAVKTLRVSEIGASSLQGIEYFHNLEYLWCDWNALTELDVSKNTKLKSLYCHDNQLRNLDVSKNTVLDSLSCSNNQLVNLEINACTALTYLSCDYNQLATLDVSQCSALTRLYCNGNQLTNLDVRNCAVLTSLGCANNQLSSLDVSNCSSLTWLDCYVNQISSLDVTNCPLLTTLQCQSNQLNSLDVSNCAALNWLSCDSNQLSSLDVGNCLVLTSLSCGNNQLSRLDISKNTKLESLYCAYNQLLYLDVSENTAMTTLYCDNNQLSSLDVSNCTALTYLSCNSNRLSSLDVSMTALTYVNCYGNSFSVPLTNAAIDLSTFSEVFDVDKAFDWKGGHLNGIMLIPDSIAYKITYTYDCGNGLSCNFTIEVIEDIPLDEAHFPDESFRAYLADRCDEDQNKLLSRKERLGYVGEYFYLSNKNIQSLEGVEYFPALTTLYCDNNQLTNLDVSNNTALTSLSCNGNQLTSLDVSNCSALTTLSCSSNSYTAEFLDRTLDLATLPGNFDVARASNWTGGTVEGNILTLNNGAVLATYQYDCGNGKSVKLTIQMYGAGATISVTVTPWFSDQSVKVTLEDYSTYKVIGTVTLAPGETSCSFSGLAYGKYLLSPSQTDCYSYSTVVTVSKDVQTVKLRVYRRGDLDQDRDIDADDLDILLQHLRGVECMTNKQLKYHLADLDKNGSLTARDAILMLQLLG